MALKDICKNMKTLLETIADDMDKAEAGNKAASQRIRTNSIKFEKAAKLYRKESIRDEKKGGGKKKASSAKAPKRAAPSKPHSPASRSAKKKAPTKKKKATSKSMERKRPTAKLPKKR